VFCLVRSIFLFLGHYIGNCVGKWKTTKLFVRTISPSQIFITRPARSLSHPTRHSSCIAVNWSLTQREIRLAQRADNFWLVKCQESKERKEFFLCGNAEKLKILVKGTLWDEITANSSIYSCEIHQICMF